MRYGLDAVEVTYGAHKAVYGVSFEIAPGSVTALVGGDGAGKTTLLRSLAGRVRPSAGTVRRPEIEHTGVLAAGPPGYDDLTVAENMRFALRVRGMDTPDGHDRADTLVAAIGLTDARDRLAARLSGGMRRKLGFALATLHEPDLLLLDEPTTGIDPVSRTELWRLIAAAAGRGAGVVLATTYIDEAERCAQVLALHRGRVLAQGDPDDITEAVRGRLYRAATPGPPERSWRRGSDWRVWAPDGSPPVDASPVEPDLEDAVVVAMLDDTAQVVG